MKKLLIVLGLSLTLLSSLSAQEIFSRGQVVDATDGRAVSTATLEVRGRQEKMVAVDNEGRYLIPEMKPGKYTVTVLASGYEAQQFFWQGKEGDLSIIRLRPLAARLPMQDLSELLTEDLGTTTEEDIQESSPLLTASRDPYANAAGYTFGPMRFRMRGLDSPYQLQYLNGLQMNDLNTGYSVWSLWGGLNDAVRNQHSILNNELADFSFGGVGGATLIDTRASGIRAGSRLTYSVSNRTYTNRLMYTYASGLTKSGWAFAFSGSRRYGSGDYSYVRGQHYDAWGYFASIEKRLAGGHTFLFSLLAAPTERGVASGSTEEVYKLVGSNYYNPNIGRQAGQWRNARVRNNHEPVLTLSYIWEINKGTRLTAATGYRFGYNAYSALNWANAQDPRPDYYRNLPSYYTYLSETPDQETADYYAMLWRSDENVRYIDWDMLYHLNSNNYKETYDAQGNLLASGKRSEYILEDRRTDQRQWYGSLLLNSQLNDNYRIDGGVNYRINKTENFNVIKDLLGGEYWYDVDKFAENEFVDATKAQMDMRNPNHIARKGDKIGHNYLSHIQAINSWFALRANYTHLDAYLGGQVSVTSMCREGLQQRGLFPTNSYGKSETLDFVDWGAKMGFTYKINGHHFVSLNAVAMSQAPVFRNVFVSPRTRNTHVEDPQSEKVFSADLNYLLRLPLIRGRVSAFYTRINDRTRNMSFYDDGHRAFSNYILSGIDEQNAGIEIGLEAKLSPTLVLNGAFTYGHYTYVSNPKFVQTVDNSEKELARERVYWDGFNTSGTPQTAGTIGFTYNSPRYWFLSANVNYFGRSFVAMNPIRRTDQAREELAAEFIKRETFDGGFTVDASVGKSFRLSRSTFLRMNLSASNLLNNRNLRSGGYEQLRIRRAKEDGRMTRPFDSKYFYMYGTTFFLNASLQF
ncbi:TonB-dependent receptor [Porphyromonas crevioricanis]|uniref:carboxypeptidase-like regulatory domain-containing protein n=1 Tax=Porphyromonas crevioricanis TaxID=393921 RepID=UPI00052D05FC|nr:carboxypeptidase-like regulatory domain-containing protein [Porphyromonas crevioricanis]KGN89392.1 TonB-dependent receptor [Porphyromonas crevioricanis]